MPKKSRRNKNNKSRKTRRYSYKQVGKGPTLSSLRFVSSMKPPKVHPTTLLSLEELTELKKHLTPASPKDMEVGKTYYFDNPDNGLGYRYTMESGKYVTQRDFREPRFTNINILYKADLDEKCVKCKEKDSTEVTCSCGFVHGKGNFKDYEQFEYKKDDEHYMKDHAKGKIREHSVFNYYEME